MKKILFVILIVIILIKCFEVFRFILNLDSGYEYSNRSGTFRATENAHRSPKLNGIIYNFDNNFKPISNKKENKTLYRNFTKNPLKFWNWYSYFSNPRYDLPYLSEDSIKKD